MKWPHFHKWSAWINKSHYTGQLTIRPSDGMVMATLWTDRYRRCTECGQEEVFEDFTRYPGCGPSYIPTGLTLGTHWQKQDPGS